MLLPAAADRGLFVARSGPAAPTHLPARLQALECIRTEVTPQVLVAQLTLVQSGHDAGVSYAPDPATGAHRTALLVPGEAGESWLEFLVCRTTHALSVRWHFARTSESGTLPLTPDDAEAARLIGAFVQRVVSRR